MTARLLPLCLGLVLFAHSATSAADPVIARKKVGRAEQALTKYLDTLQAPHGWIHQLSQERLTRVFPGYTFFQVRYAIGSARRLPEGLKEVNLFFIDAAGKVHGLNETSEMIALFRERFVDVTSERSAAQAAQVLAVLGMARHPGYIFAPVEVKTTSDPNGVTATVRMPVREGGTGHGEAELHFSKKGLLNKFSTSWTVKRDRRIVRTAALVKRATTVARNELVRLNLSAATLQAISEKETEEAFPGHVFFSFVGESEKTLGWGGTGRQLIVVEPDGQAVVLERITDLGSYVRAAYDPITTDEQARHAMHLFLRLLQVRYPAVTFKEMRESIRVEADAAGGRTVTGKLDAESGARGHIDVTWRFGKRGRLTLATMGIRQGQGK